MDGTTTWEPPPPLPKRRNVIIRIYDAPIYRDWAAWLTGCAGLLAGFSIGFSKPPAGLPAWLNTSLAILFFVGAFGVIPAVVRLRIRRLMWRRRMNQDLSPPEPQMSLTNLPGGSVQAKEASGGDLRATNQRVTPVPGSVLSAAKTVETKPRTSVASAPVDSGEFVRSSVVLKRTRDSLQYPIARAVRALQVATSSRDRYDCIIDAAEALLITLGIVAAAWLRSAEMGAVEIGEFRDALLGRGVAQGHWHKMIIALARCSNESDRPLPGVVDGLRRMKKGKGDLLASLEELIAERNRSAHGGRPRNETEADLRIADFFPMLELAVDRAAFLAEIPWFLVRSSSFRRQDANFRVTADRVMGDHPEFETYSFGSATPLADDNFYMTEEWGSIDLSPFLVVRYCDECHEREVFYADKLDRAKGVALKSFGRGHTVFDQALSDEVRALA